MNRNRLLAFGLFVVIAALTLLFFWKILLTNLILSGVDVFLYFYPYKEYTAIALREGRLPLWNPHLFMGAPLLANSQVGLFYFPNWFFIGLNAPKQIAWSIGLHITLAGVFMLAFTRQSLKLGWPAALVAAIIFAFGGYLGAQVEHINQLQAAAWLPLLFLLYDFTLHRSKRLIWLLLLALSITLVLLAGHTQTAFISLFGLGLYGLWQAVFENIASPGAKITTTRYIQSLFKNLVQHLWPLAVVSILAVAMAAIQLLPTAELSGLSIRSGGLTFREVVSFSLRPTALHYSLLPPLSVDLTQILGQAFSEWVAYLGVSGLILAGLGIFSAVWQTITRRFVFLSVAGLTLSLGLYSGPVYLFLYYFVPGFSLFRVPARWLLLYAFAMAVLAGFGFQALTEPKTLRARLSAVQKWFRQAPWRLILPLIPLLGLLTLIAWKTPPLVTLLAWIILSALTIASIWLILKEKLAAVAALVLMILLVVELFWSSQALNYNRPTAPQAYTSMRNATAFLLSTDPPHLNTPPGRFLSLSGIIFDPGDMVDLQAIFDHLPDQAVYDLIVATKEKEVLFFNLPMIYGLHSVDGYDGGILPLSEFITFQKLFLPEDSLSVDGRLRENLKFVPSNRLLSLINTRWIVTDKQFDAWINGIFYDLQFPAILAPGETIATGEIPTFRATAIGLVSHLEGAAGLPDNSLAANIILTFADGSSHTISLKTGADTAEGNYSGSVPHTQAEIGVTWPYQAAGVDYIAVHPLPSSEQITEIAVESMLPEGQFVLRGVSLIHQPTTTSRSILLSTEGDYRQVHSGDVKIYENRQALPRAFVVHQTQVMTNEDEAITAMQDAGFDPRQHIVRIAAPGESTDIITRGDALLEDKVRIVAYTPERVELAVEAASPGWLVLTDAYYPGWQARVDGQLTEIEQVNIMFRAVPVNQGAHSVLFEFRPRSFQLGAVMSGLVFTGVVLGLIIAGWRKGFI